MATAKKKRPPSKREVKQPPSPAETKAVLENFGVPIVYKGKPEDAPKQPVADSGLEKVIQGRNAADGN